MEKYFICCRFRLYEKGICKKTIGQTGFFLAGSFLRVGAYSKIKAHIPAQLNQPQMNFLRIIWDLMDGIR